MLYSETFKSIQGEGHYTGVPTVWLRMFGCNLECQGFGQDDPTDPSTYKLPYLEHDLIEVKRVEDLPVWKYGCDSSYSWSKKYAKLQKRGSPEEVAKILYDMMNDHRTHIAFTGGEPMMKAAQKNIVKVYGEIKKLFEAENEWGYYGKKYNNNIRNITFETNGTRPIEPVMNDLIRATSLGPDRTEWFFSVSPKLWHTAGEKDRICPDIVKGYQDACGHFDGYQGNIEPMGQLKFVCNGSKESWDEIEDAVASFRHSGVMYPIWIMPVGATEESQDEIAKEITIETMNRGYNVAARVHCYIFGNQIGT